jgi:hypothetical protein
MLEGTGGLTLIEPATPVRQQRAQFVWRKHGWDLVPEKRWLGGIALGTASARSTTSGQQVSSTFVHGVVAFAVAVIGMWVVPAGWTELRGRTLRIGGEAVALNATGILVFTYLLARAMTTEAPRAILIVITTQTALTGVWAGYHAGSFQPRVLVGRATALATVFLLRG